MTEPSRDAESTAGARATSTPLTFADALRCIESWTDLPDLRRRDLASALRTASRFVGLPPAAIPCDCAFLNDRLFERPPKAQGVSARRFSNVVSGVRTVMRRLGRSWSPTSPIKPELSPSWSALLDLVTNKHHRLGLIGLARFCSADGIAPERVDDGTLLAYRAFIATESIRANAHGRARTAMQAWNRAVAAIPGWPQMVVGLPSRRPSYTIPLSALPSSFQRDVERFADRLSGETGAALFSKDGPPRRLRPATVKTRVAAIRQAVGALIRSGVDPSTLSSLHDLVQPIGRVQAIFGFFWDRAGGKATTNTATVSETLRQIAKHFCALEGEDLDLIERWTGTLRPDRRGGLTPMVRERLRHLIQPLVRARLLHLPAELMRRAADMTDDPAAAAQLAEEAAALEILLVCPLRFGNLIRLRLDTNLQRIGVDGRHVTHLVLVADEVKNGLPIEWPLPPSSARLLETWIARHRPQRTTVGNPFLFPGAGAAHREHSGLSKVLARRVAQETGAKVHMHLLRHFAAWLYLNACPGDYETTRRILAHRSIETTIRCYCGLEAEAAARRFDEVVLGERRRSLAPARRSRDRVGRADRRRAGVGS